MYRFLDQKFSFLLLNTECILCTNFNNLSTIFYTFAVLPNIQVFSHSESYTRQYRKLAFASFRGIIKIFGFIWIEVYFAIYFLLVSHRHDLMALDLFLLYQRYLEKYISRWCIYIYNYLSQTFYIHGTQALSTIAIQ